MLLRNIRISYTVRLHNFHQATACVNVMRLPHRLFTQDVALGEVHVVALVLADLEDELADVRQVVAAHSQLQHERARNYKENSRVPLAVQAIVARSRIAKHPIAYSENEPGEFEQQPRRVEIEQLEDGLEDERATLAVLAEQLRVVERRVELLTQRQQLVRVLVCHKK